MRCAPAVEPAVAGAAGDARPMRPPPRGLGRRRALRAGIAAALAGAAPTARADGRLYLYNWNNYVSEETIRRFERACGCDVRQDYYSSNEELLAKLAAGALGYDVLVPTGNAVETLIRQGALLPVDTAALANFRNLDPHWLDTPFDPGNRHSVPYAFSITLVGGHAERLRDAGVPLDSWAAVFEPELLRRLKGRVTVLDDARELLAAALRYLGLSVNERDERRLKQARDLILRAKPHWAAFNASSYIKELTVGNVWLAHGYSNDMFQARADARRAGRPFSIDYRIPREGAVLALDSMVIHRGARRPDLAMAFIDFMLDGRNSADLTNLIGSGNPNAAALPFIDPRLRDVQAIFPDAAQRERLEMLRDHDRRTRRLVNRLWTEIKVR
jgi:spermidine/putrescine transport system substrate-binding protein